MSPRGYTPGKLYQLLLSDVQLDPDNPRKYIDPQAMDDLTSSIKQHRVLEPILVRAGADPGKFIIVTGERRYRASVALGLPTIPAIFTTGDALEITIVENLLRQGYTAIEEAEGIEKLRTAKDYRSADIARLIGLAESTVSEILSLNKLPQSIRDDCRNDHKASRRILKTIAKQKPEKMVPLYEKYKANGLITEEYSVKRTSLKKEAAAGAEEAAAKAAVDFSFVQQFAGRLKLFDVGRLDAPQGDALMADLVALRLITNEKVKTLKARPQTSEAPSPASAP